MLNSQLETFIDRREAIALFERLCVRDPNQPRPLLPILTFAAPAGSGKSMLIEYLHIKKCCNQDGHASLPYAHLDFTDPQAPKTLLSILVALRNKLQRCADERGRYLTFPCFDLGAAITLAATKDETLQNTGDIERKLLEESRFIKSLDTAGNLLDSAGLAFGLLVAGIKLLTTKTKVMRELIGYLESRRGWEWYRDQFTNPPIPGDANIFTVLERLKEMSMPGSPDRKELIEHLLPAAFLVDLHNALDNAPDSRAWNKHVNVALFLDGFDALLDEYETGFRLLEALTQQRRNGQNDPLLLVIGSRQHLTRGKLDVPAAETRDEQSPEQYALKLYQSWQEQPLRNVPTLRLNDLYLELQLPDFGPADIHEYLSLIATQRQSQAPANVELVNEIYNITNGHPLYLALVTTAALDGQDLAFNNLSAQEPIEDRFLSLFLHQLSSDEEKGLVRCAAARVLDIDTLQAVLQLPDDIEARRLWDRYCRLTFTRVTENERIVLPPYLRSLLLRKLRPSLKPNAAYYQAHSRLKAHFTELSTAHEDGAEQAQIEEAYHSLALGKAESAIKLATSALSHNLPLWESVLEIVAQAPAHPSIMPRDIQQIAAEALNSARQNHTLKDTVTALIYYKWLLNTVNKKSREAASFLHNIGIAYNILTEGEQQAHLRAAIECYQRALSIYNPQDSPGEWAGTKHDLGRAYYDLPGGDRQTNLNQARSCYLDALQVYTNQTFPEECAATKHDLGQVLYDLHDADRHAHLEQAIMLYEDALDFYIRKDFRAKCAEILNKQGDAYSELPGYDKQALDCYRAARKFSNSAGPVEPLPPPAVPVQPAPPVLFNPPSGTNISVPVIEPAANLYHTPPPPAVTLPQPTLPPQAPSKKLPRRIKVFLFLLCALAIFSLLYGLYAWYSSSNTNCNPSGNTPVQATCVIQASDRETIGISNGTFAFDTVRADGDLKNQAADKLKAGDPNGALALWQQAIKIDENDPETLIYQEDQNVINSGSPYITIIIPTILSGSNIGVGRDNLQGAYVTQKEFNVGAKLGRLQVRLLIANAGDNTRHAADILEGKIEQAVHADHTIVGIMGWPFSSPESLDAITRLGKAGIPMVSPTASTDKLTGISPYFFRVAPSNLNEGIATAHYAEQTLQARTVAIFRDCGKTNNCINALNCTHSSDCGNPYSSSLAEDFKSQLTKDGYQVVDEEPYTVGNAATVEQALQKMKDKKIVPDIIFFSGYAVDLSTLLVDLPTSGPYTSLQVLSGDAAYELGGILPDARINLDRLHLVVFAYPDEWQILCSSQPLACTLPRFYAFYAQDFDPQHLYTAQKPTYGYNRAESDTILSYDATLALLTAVSRIPKSNFSLSDVQHALTTISGLRAMQGVSGQISFDSHGDATYKAMVILYVAQGGYFREEQSQPEITPTNFFASCFMDQSCSF